MDLCKCARTKKKCHTTSESIRILGRERRRQNRKKSVDHFCRYTHHYDHHQSACIHLVYVVALMGPAPKHFHYYAFLSFVFSFSPLLVCFLLLDANAASTLIDDSSCILRFLSFFRSFYCSRNGRDCSCKKRNITLPFVFLARHSNKMKAERNTRVHMKNKKQKKKRENQKIKNNIENIFVRCWCRATYFVCSIHLYWTIDRASFYSIFAFCLFFFHLRIYRYALANLISNKNYSFRSIYAGVVFLV